MLKSKFCYVTSFSKIGYSDYGKKFIQGFEKNIQEELLVVLDQNFEVNSFSKHIKLLNNKFTLQIKKTYKNFETAIDYRFAPNRFCYKTSAIYTALSVCQNKYKYLVWLDADSLVKRNDLTKYLESLTPDDDQIASFFDRDRSFGYSETGVIIFNLEHTDTEKFIQNWNDAFVTGDILNYSEWHEAFYFSHLVRCNRPGLFRFLCKDLGLKTTHPIFELKPLRMRIEHLKGETRKKIGFSPEKYLIPAFIFRLVSNLIRRKS